MVDRVSQPMAWYIGEGSLGSEQTIRKIVPLPTKYMGKVDRNQNGYNKFST